MASAFGATASSSKPTTLIIGGSVTGLSVGLALSSKGFRVHVVEKEQNPWSTETADQGSLEPVFFNKPSLECLAAWGVKDFGPFAERDKPLDIRSWSGRLLRRMFLNGVTLRWQDAVQVLHEHLKARDAVIDFGRRCTDFIDVGWGAVAEMADNSRANGDVLIGADGMESTVRHKIVTDDSGLRPLGIVEWTGTLRDTGIFAGINDAFNIFLGPGAHVVTSRFPSGLISWSLFLPPPPDAVLVQDLDRVSPYAEAYAAMCKFIIDTPILKQLSRLILETETVRRMAVCDRHPSRVWGHGRAMLLGHAAHSISGFNLDGANHAVADAAALAASLYNLRIPEELVIALERCQERRMNETRVAVLEARKTGWARMNADVDWERATTDELTEAQVITETCD